MASEPNLKTAPDQGGNSSCRACKRTDSAETMVACDRCDFWWHYSCAGVTPSVQTKEWLCSLCTRPRASSLSGLSATSSRAALYELNLKRIEEQKRLEMKRLDIEEKHLNEKYRLLEYTLQEENRSVHSQKSIGHSKVAEWMANLPISTNESNAAKNKTVIEEEGAVGRVDIHERQSQQDAPSKQPYPDNKKVRNENHSLINLPHPGGKKNPSTSNVKNEFQLIKALSQQLHEFQTEPSGDDEEKMRRLIERNRNCQLQANSKGQPHEQSTARVSTGAVPKNAPTKYTVDDRPDRTNRQPLARASHPATPNNRIGGDIFSDSNETDGTEVDEERSDASETGMMSTLSKQRFPLDKMRQSKASGQALVPPQLYSPEAEQRLTHQQLAARQVLPRSLPVFSGNPADWPVFISNYNYTTEACGYSEVENMIRLQQCLKGPAWESVRSRLILPASVPHVVEALRMRYGRSEMLIESLIIKVKNAPSPRSDKLETIIEFGMLVQTLHDHIVASNLLDHIANPTLLKDLVIKLPAEYKMRWAAYRRNFVTANIETFSQFMDEIVNDAYSVSCPTSFDKSEKRNLTHAETGGSAINWKVQPVIQSTAGSIECAVCKKEGYRARDCRFFQSLSIDERWRKVQSSGLCRTCLYGHGRRSCRSTKRCEIDGCKSRHHPLLHSTYKSGAAFKAQPQAEHYTHRSEIPSLFFRIVPVTVYNGEHSIDTYAFVDEGSSLTMIEESLADRLGVEGYDHPLCLKWTGNMQRNEKDSRRVRLQISGRGNYKKYLMTEVCTVKSLDLPMQSLPFDSMVDKYAYLKGLPIRSYRNAIPQLLIGLDNLNVALPLKMREGVEGEPVAVKTRLGWCIYGSTSKENTSSYNYHVCECGNDRSLDEAMKIYFKLEDAGGRPSASMASAEDRRAYHILESTTVLTKDRYESGLLWKCDVVEFPDSFPMALQRLKCLERRMARNPPLSVNVRNQIKEYEDKGYAHRTTPEELKNADPRRTWFLPLGVVINAKKPGKVRLIWDASAKVDGVSLNSWLLKGPDENTLLPAVLFLFRQYPVAVSSDIKEMYHQIGIREQDRSAQRFLWRDDPTKQPEIYTMDVATFGSACSPATALCVKNVNAKRFIEKFPRAVEGIVHRYYVDDYLDSFQTAEEAYQTALEIKAIHQHGGFNIRNWCSNEPSVLEQLGEKRDNAIKHLHPEKNSQSERVLGILWATDTDEFKFPTTMRSDIMMMIENNTKPTKRQILRCVMTLFDPLGLLAPYIVLGKMLVQETWCARIGWDECVTDDIFEHWKTWVATLKHIDTVRIPRCYFRNTNSFEKVQLHTFTDASQLAYCSVSYLRVVNLEGNVEVALVMAKSRVAPLKPVTIPRLELQACTQGARLNQFVKDGHSLKISKHFLWTDSSTALSWINSDPRRFRPYVSFRVAEILELTDRNEWRWVPSKQNPADEATKWGSGPYFKANSIWYSGPEFLYKHEAEWPQLRQPVPIEEELRACYAHRRLIGRVSVIDFQRFSKYNRLLRAMAYVHRFINYTRRQKPSESQRSIHLSSAELRQAEQSLFAMSQWQSYPDEVATLKHNMTLPATQRKPIEKSSSIYTLTPMMDKNGVLRVDGRTGAARRAPSTVKYPIILSYHNRLTALIVDEQHKKLHHGNNETVVNELRQRYYIPKLRTLVKKRSTSCQLCRIRKAKPKVPLMSPLPEARLSSFARPFSYVGLDYFGPITVKLGRSHVKRWIALFTCLTIRAVHVEVASNLSTESCILAVRRFVCRRGFPVVIYSDNGTNFQGAERLLREQIEQGLEATFTSTTTNWKFNPPSAPHMGGSWERLVRSVKTALGATCDNDNISDEDLLTIVIEAESIVNSRPLTYLPIDSAEQESLTPNHFLLGSSSGIRQPIAAAANECSLLKRSWGRIQKLLDRFWKRWVLEYLPTLTKRTKWFEESRATQPGELVLIIDDTTRNKWTRGRILKVITAADGRARQAEIMTTKGILRRPVAKLAILDVSDETGNARQFHRGENFTKEAKELATLLAVNKRLMP
ncbi:uncharacterized protein LOC129728904 [Wyeomyia smithii]|uniref:uncharacterized protein LOC129728904 n=1 Tax=Wyeomyia smithii TaxID=174621 RepID=UPI002467E038|nr:uncharacterized protein LOC129728904 [Wyeomyia smithii]